MNLKEKFNNLFRASRDRLEDEAEIQDDITGYEKEEPRGTRIKSKWLNGIIIFLCIAIAASLVYGRIKKPNDREIKNKATQVESENKDAGFTKDQPKNYSELAKIRAEEESRNKKKTPVEKEFTYVEEKPKAVPTPAVPAQPKSMKEDLEAKAYERALAEKEAANKSPLHFSFRKW